LSKHQVGYDVGNDLVIKELGKVDGKQMVVGNSKYEVVILPPSLENIDLGVFKLLEEFASRGGKILSFANIPIYINGEVSDKPARMVLKNPGSFFKLDSLGQEVLNNYLLDKNFLLM
jgi:hypothetical protein